MDGPAGQPADNAPNSDGFGSLPSNGIRVDGSGLLTSHTAHLATARVGPGPGPDAMFRNRC